MILRLFYILASVCCAFGVCAQESDALKVAHGMYIHDGAIVGIHGNLVNTDTILTNQGKIVLLGDSLHNTSGIVGNGTLEMSGVYDQHISGGGGIIMDSLILNNKLNISFDNNLLVNEHLAFIDGILYDNFTVEEPVRNLPSVTFGENADFDTTLVRNESHVEGMVRKKGRTRFIFPIGDMGVHRPVVASNITEDTLISAHYYYEWINFPEEKVQLGVELFRDEYWYVSGNANTYSLTLTYNEATSTFDPDDALTDIQIAGYDKDFDQRIRLLDVEPRENMAEIGYLSDSLSGDTTSVWFGFAATSAKMPEDGEFYVPQLITPNADGANDFLEIPGLGNHPDNRVVIMNRHGNKVFEASNYQNDWNGVSNQNVIGGSAHEVLPSGTYYVFLYIEDELVYKGFLQLLSIGN